ncbi:integrating conjugative element protein [Legionella taurinensis]|nr:integrating conjugative element protein [Legionella taurinensis]STY25127.1 integrating conjugative element protein, PFL_4695 family [Legionella taurinensis]
MRKISLIAGLLMITSCYAYQVIDMEHYIKESQEQLSEESLKLQVKLDARLPATSKATAGKVLKRKLELVNFSYSIFIIGDDAASREWLKDHAQELEKINALGFITNIDSSSSLQELQELTKAPLLPANVDDLLAIFNESHYPLIFHEGEIWQ